MKVNKIIIGDCIEEMKKLPENSVDAIITDPPYGLEFMGKEWDKLRPKEGSERMKGNFKGERISGGDFGERIGIKLGSPKKNPRCRNCGKLKFDHEKGKCKCKLPDWNTRQSEYAFLQQVFHEEWAKECLRILKPGGYLLSFGGTRTYHRLVCGIEDAGFEIRDTIMWLYGSGFPKSLNIGKQIDKLNGKRQEEFIELGKYLLKRRKELNKPQSELSKSFLSKTGGITGCVSNWEKGCNVPTKEQWIILKRELKLDDKFDYIIERKEADREIIGLNPSARPNFKNHEVNTYPVHSDNEMYLTAPATQEAKQWEGWGTALKPAVEPIVVARKPLSEKNVALNVLKWGTGGINIDATRITYKNDDDKPSSDWWSKKGGVLQKNKQDGFIPVMKQGQKWSDNPIGRFPANIILDEEAGKMLDEQSGCCGGDKRKSKPSYDKGYWGNANNKELTSLYNDKGGASRFFYCAKASKSERNFGCEELEIKKAGSLEFRNRESGKGQFEGEQQFAKNNHPTVKPIKLMEYLVKLVSKEGAVILDPFLGSGTTAIACIKQGRNFIGIEKEKEYVKIAEARIRPFMEQSKLNLMEEKCQ